MKNLKKLDTYNMKTEKEITNKINELIEEMNELNNERNEKKNKYGGISEEENQDFFDDINHKWVEIKTLRYVLK